MSEEVAVRTAGLSKTFGALRAVDRLDLSIRRNGIFGFLGPNGAGKTTTLRLLLGVLEPTEGKAEVFGLDTRLHGESVRACCGALLEHHGLYERLSAEENLLFHGRINRMSDPAILERGGELLGQLGLWERRGERVGEWSKGMKQSLAIARALLHKPRLLLLDEPTSGLDARAAAELRRNLVSMVRQEDVTVFMTTHNLAEAEEICDSVGIFARGRLLAVGAPDDLRRGASAPRVLIRADGLTGDLAQEIEHLPRVRSARVQGDEVAVEMDGDPEPGAIVAWFVSRGMVVHEVGVERVSLEEVFLSLLEEER